LYRYLRSERDSFKIDPVLDKELKERINPFSSEGIVCFKNGQIWRCMPSGGDFIAVNSEHAAS